MTTVDASGAIHGSDGRFTGHVGLEPDISLTSSSLFTPQAIPLSDQAALAAHRAYTSEVGAARNAIQEQMDRLDAQLFVREMTAEWAAAEIIDLNLTRVDTAAVSITDDEEDGERAVYVARRPPNRAESLGQQPHTQRVLRAVRRRPRRRGRVG
ncbi:MULTISPECIES: hypothetical protein [Branchiibius]|uniref:Uncharacterized protein n=1 Tax=Branchiibius cervicis TaxID=908252 RepID=A0ABW2AUK6_9MICO|nr:MULTISPECIES: hypothetical protein [Branchiibius]